MPSQTYADLIRDAAGSRFTEPSDLLADIDLATLRAYVAHRQIHSEAREALAELTDELDERQTDEVFVHLLTAVANPELADGIAGRLLRELLLPAFKASVAADLSQRIEAHRELPRDPWAESHRRHDALASMREAVTP